METKRITFYHAIGAVINSGTIPISGPTTSLTEHVGEDVNENVMTLGQATKIIEEECDNPKDTKTLRVTIIETIRGYINGVL